MQTMQTLFEVRQSEPTTNLVESTPVQERRKLSQTLEEAPCTWNDLRGLTWVFDDTGDW